MDELVVPAWFVVSATVGYAWGRAGARLRIPELLLMLAGPACMGVLGVVGGAIVFVGRLRSNAAFAEHFMTTSVPELLCAGVLQSAVCFAVAAALAFPAIFGWAAGHRSAR